MGLSTGGSLTPESAASFQQEVIAGCDLVDSVADGTRQSFERLRHLHSYGVLFYDAFTIAGDLAHSVAELALRERFIDYYNCEIPLTELRSGEVRPIRTQSFEVVDEALRRGSHKKGDWGLRGVDNKLKLFRGSMADLLEWARSAGLLPGQRSRLRDSLWVAMRNSAAHPQFHRFGPVESARSIIDLAELINQLRGTPTEGGRLFPAARERVIQVIAWRDNEVAVGSPGTFHDLEDLDSWACVVVRAIADEPNLVFFDAEFERTSYPVDLLFGPAPILAARDWADAADLSTDTVEHIDRLFALQLQGRDALPPRRPEVALVLAPDERKGRWLLVRADHPDDAYGYGRAVAQTGWDSAGESRDVGNDFAVTPILHAADWETLARCLVEDFGVVTSERPQAFRVPSWRSEL